MTQVFYEGTHKGEYRIAGANGDRGTESGVVASGQELEAGQVCKGPLTGVTAAAADDTAGLMISYRAVDASDAAVNSTFDVRDWTVNGNDLVFADGITQAQKDAQIAALATNGIIVRF